MATTPQLINQLVVIQNSSITLTTTSSTTGPVVAGFWVMLPY